MKGTLCVEGIFQFVVSLTTLPIIPGYRKMSTLFFEKLENNFRERGKSIENTGVFG
jgi:hypothetical protein